jgi:enolase
VAFEIKGVQAIEILDSRGRPTLNVTVSLADGTVAEAGVPSGASTGTREAVELRDGDPARFGGGGVQTAVGNVNSEINASLSGRTWNDLAEVDQAMRDLDGTPNKARLGANALIGTSMALARALATSVGAPLYEWLPGFGQPARLPVPCFNVLNGGAHAPNPLDFQEFMVCPFGAPTMAEAVRAGAEVYQALRKRLIAGGHATGLGDEGGFAPNLAEPEEVLALIVASIEDAGYPTGKAGVAIALDPAASEFHQKDGTYRPLHRDDRRLPDLEHRGRAWRGRQRRLEATHGSHRRPRATGR